MKKTVSVNIKGMNFLIEEEAYEYLKQYMDKLAHVLKNDKGGKEIIEDIELRIAELCAAKLNDRKQVIDTDDIKSILDTLGDPSQFIDDDKSTKEDSFQSTNDQKQSSDEKRLFRDLENASIAGVCSGIANYLNIDVVIVRAIFLVIFFFGGFGLPMYFILWIVIPKANTTIDKLRMRGKPITVDSVREEVESAAEKVTKESKSFFSRIKNEEAIGKRVSNIINFLIAALGIGMICFAIFVLIMFLIFGFGGMQIIPVQSESGFLSLPQLGSLVLNNTSDYNWAWWGLSIAIFSGVLFILLLGVKLLFRIKNRWSRISLGLIFTSGIIGSIMCFVIGAKTGRDFSIEGEIEREVGQIYSTEIQLIGHPSRFKASSEFNIKSNGRYGLIGIQGKHIVESGIHLEYKLSKDSLYHIYQNFSAHSHSYRQALNKAKNIKHSISIKNSEVHLNTFFSYPMNDKLRDQEVYIVIEIPEGKNVRVGNQHIRLGSQEFHEEINTNESTEDGYLNSDGKYEHWD